MSDYAPHHHFELEHYQSLYEHTVDINLADSSVQCLTTREWLEPSEQAALLDTGLFYPQVNGTDALRARIAALHPGATAENVLVTIGAAQANAMVCTTLLRPGDEVVVLSPGYRQIYGLALNAGCTVKELPLIESLGWRFDPDQLDALVGPRTRLVAIVNPNNPTGTILTVDERARIVAACARVGAWLHADEVYRGTEHSGVETPSFWGSYDRLICTSSLSKAYGLAGLRIGWALSDAATIDAMWRRHEYAVIAAAAPSMTLATIALDPAKRPTLIARQRTLTREGRAVLDEWLATEPRFGVGPSDATAIGFVNFDLPLTSYELAEHIRKTTNLLVAPGSLMGAEGHLRITLGYAPSKIRKALDRISSAVATLELAEVR